VLLDLLDAFLYILGYLLELIIKIWRSGIFIFISKCGESGPFFSWKILCIGQNHIFQVKIWPPSKTRHGGFSVG